MTVGDVKINYCNEKEAKILFQKLLFYNTFIEKPRIKRLTNIDLLHELSFYDELNIRQTSKAFKTYARNYRIEITDSKDSSFQLKASKSSINELFKGLLGEIKGYKYQIIVQFLLSQHKDNIPNIIFINFSKKVCIGLITGLMKDLIR